MRRQFFIIVLVAGIYSAGAKPVISVAVDDQKSSNSSMGVTAPSTARKFSFRISGDAGDGGSALKRFRYRLSGVDSDWKERSSEMDFSVGLYNHAGDRISYVPFPVVGKSAGWNHSPEDSVFTHRYETVKVPPGADRFVITVTSAGPPEAVGVYIVTDVSVSRASSMSSAVNAVRYPASCWLADGTHPSMAQLLNAHKSVQLDKALWIVDSDSTGHAEWRTKSECAFHITPGETLIIEWNEIHNIGMSILTPVAYGPLPAGDYQFLAQWVDVLDCPVGDIAKIPIRITAPYWKTSWFWIGLSIALATVSLVAGRYVLYRKLKRQKENFQLLEHERLRIARDLHDDLGARLTHIALMSARGKTAATGDECRTNLFEISSVTRELVTSLADTVWTVNPKNDNLDSLIGFLCRLVHTQCRYAQIPCRISADIEKDARIVSSDIRHNIVMALKEAVNNAIKHAEADEISLTIKFQSPALIVTLTDNGCGFANSSEPSKGDGLLNMRQRIESVGGAVQIESFPRRGTSVQFSVPVPRNAAVDQ